MMIRNIRCNFSKVFTGYGFWVCTAFTVILCFSANIYTDTMKNDQYSAFSALLTFDREFMRSDSSFCSFNVIQWAVGGWLSLFIPIVAAFPFIPLICDEYEAKSVRFEIFRSNKLVYHISRFVSGCLCGGLAVMIGFALFSLIAYLLFPSLNDYSLNEREFFLSMMSDSFPELKDGIVLPLLRLFGSMFLYGTLWAVPAITLTSLIRNKYLVLCIPFFLKYAVGQTCFKIQSQSFSDVQLMRLIRIVYPNGLAYLPQSGEIKIDILIYNGILVILAFSAYLIIQARRTDSGE